MDVNSSFVCSYRLIYSVCLKYLSNISPRHAHMLRVCTQHVNDKCHCVVSDYRRGQIDLSFLAFFFIIIITFLYSNVRLLY